MEKSLDFYKKLLQQEPSYCNDDRWITVACGLFLYNKKYDENLLKRGGNSHFRAYLDNFNKTDFPRKNNIVIFNFVVDD